MSPRVTPRFSRNRVLKECLFSQGFQEWISWAMLKIPPFTGLSSLINPRVTPQFSGNRFVEAIVFSEGFPKRTSWWLKKNASYCSVGQPLQFVEIWFCRKSGHCARTRLLTLRKRRFDLSFAFLLILLLKLAQAGSSWLKIHSFGRNSRGSRCF